MFVNEGYFISEPKDFFADNVESTKNRTNAIIDSALDGVLYIKDTHSLMIGEKDYLGKIVIETLVNRIEKDHDRLLVILAGKQKEMKEFLELYPLLRSHFNRHLTFTDYDDWNLYNIFEFMLSRKGYFIKKYAASAVYNFICESISRCSSNLCNAIHIKELCNYIVDKHQTRLSDLDNATLSKSKIIELCDVKELEQKFPLPLITGIPCFG